MRRRRPCAAVLAWTCTPKRRARRRRPGASSNVSRPVPAGWPATRLLRPAVLRARTTLRRAFRGCDPLDRRRGRSGGYAAAGSVQRVPRLALEAMLEDRWRHEREHTPCRPGRQYVSGHRRWSRCATTRPIILRLTSRAWAHPGSRSCLDPSRHRWRRAVNRECTGAARGTTVAQCDQEPAHRSGFGGTARIRQSAGARPYGPSLGTSADDPDPHRHASGSPTVDVAFICGCLRLRSHGGDGP